MGLKSRTKGHSYERFIADFYRGLGYPAKRTLQSREGYEGSDVQGTPWWVECKRYKSLGKLGAWWRKAKLDRWRSTQGISIDEIVPDVVLHLKEDQGEHLVVIPLGLWKGMLEAAL